MTMPDMTMGGEKFRLFAMKGLNGWQGSVVGLIILIFTILMFSADIGMGPFFAYGLSSVHGVELGFSGHVVPWIQSIATSGLLYALWAHVPAKIHVALPVRLVAIIMLFADGVADVGGFNSLMLQDPAAAARIILPPGAGVDKWIADGVVFFVCVFHEPLLGMVLRRNWKKVQNKAVVNFGDRVENGMVYLSGLLFNVVRAVAIWGGAISMMAIDIFLTPQLGDGFWNTVVYWGISLTCLGILVSWWRFYEHVGKDGVKSFGLLHWGLLIGSLVVTGLDTWLDLRGFNEMLYGTDAFIISVPTLAWWLTFGMTAVMSMANEPLSSQIFRPLGDMAANGQPVGLDGFEVVDFPGGAVPQGFLGNPLGPNGDSVPGMNDFPGSGPRLPGMDYDPFAHSRTVPPLPDDLTDMFNGGKR